MVQCHHSTTDSH